MVHTALGYANEVLVVDDGSIDDTGAAAEPTGAGGPPGQRRLYRGGEARGEVVVTLDADGEHRPEDIPRLVASILGRLPIDPEIAKLCDVGQIESYPAEVFVPIARRLEERAPPARSPAFPTP